MSIKIRQLWPAGLLVPVFAAAGWFAFAAPKEHELDAEKIAAAVGTKTTTTKDGVVRIAWARTDVAVTVDGMPRLSAASASYIR